MYAGNLSHSMRENYSFGVDKYYEAVQSTYRNPSFGAVRTMLWNALTVIQQHEKIDTVLDLACGAGEATSVLFEWHEACQTGKGNRRLPVTAVGDKPSVLAIDPYTGPAFHKVHPAIPFLPLSFAQIDDIEGYYTLTICSFALHLISGSELWACLDALTRKSKWLLIISPHKKPEIKTSWGWERWDTKTWNRDETDVAEIVQERVRGRLYRNVQSI